MAPILGCDNQCPVTSLPPTRRPPSPARRFHRGLISILNRLGWVIAPVADYYQPLRPVSELEKNARRWHRPSALAGISFDLPAMESTLEALIADFGAEYAALTPYDRIKAERRGPGFTRVDSLTRYLMLRGHRPARYVEVGSGLSTWYAAQAAAANARDG